MDNPPTILVTDIFGRTDALLEIAEAFLTPVGILDPYNGEKTQFDDEEQAYTTFNRRMGHDRYLKELQKKLHANQQTKYLVGFSAGATACWRAVAEMEPTTIELTVCVYGSQIRHHEHLRPRAPTTLLLPASEPSFNIEQQAKSLGKLPFVAVIPTPYQHGYMNKHSLNYNPDGYKKTLKWFRSGFKENVFEQVHRQTNRACPPI